MIMWKWHVEVMLRYGTPFLYVYVNIYYTLLLMLRYGIPFLYVYVTIYYTLLSHRTE